MDKQRKEICTFAQVDDHFHENKFVNSNSRYEKAINLMMSDIQEFERRKGKKDSPQIRIVNDFSSGVIDVDTLTTVIHGLQRTFNGAYNAIRGNGSNIGRIPKRVMKESQLVVTGFSKGSFIIEFNSIENITESRNEELLEIDFNEIELLNDLLDNINHAVDYTNVSNFVESFGVRTFNYTREWFKDLSLKNVEIEYKNPKYEIDTYFDKPRIKHIADTLSKIDIKESVEIINMNGKLVGVNQNSSYIDFLINDRNEVKVKIKDDSLEHLKLTTNEYYSLDINKIEVNDSIGKSSIIYEAPTLKGTEMERP